MSSSSFSIEKSYFSNSLYLPITLLITSVSFIGISVPGHEAANVSYFVSFIPVVFKAAKTSAKSLPV